MAERQPVSQKPHNPDEFPARIVPRRKVTINHAGLENAAVYDGPGRLEAYYHLTTPAVKRLGYDPATAGNAKTKPPKAAGNSPNTLDLKRWLDSLQDTPDDEDEVGFLLTTHATIRSRLPETVTTKIHAE